MTPATGLALAIPEVGQLVRVRDRHWVVTNLVPSTLPENVGNPSHLVELSSVEDDAYGDELTVFWEVEPGTVVLPKATLPQPSEGFDEPGRLAAFLDAVRWGAIASADARALQAPFRSGISIEEYQLDPVVRALQMPRVNLLIADDVGLGKTIEAGLVIQELLLRHRARTVLVVCPASLCLKWQAEMHDRFGLEFQIVDADAVRHVRRERGVGANVWTSFPRLIVSIDWLKAPRAMALLDAVLPPDANVYPRKFDLLVVDEVHQCAPAGRGAYATDSLRTIALRKIASHFEHRLFLSATPHNGYTESFTALLELLDPQRFARGVKPSEEAQRRILVRRLKSELRKELPPHPDGTPRFPERLIIPLRLKYPASEREIHDALRDYTALRRKRAVSKTSQTATDFVTLLLKKRLFSSPKAFLETLREHMKTLGRRGAAEHVSESRLRAEFDRLEEDVDSDDAFTERTQDALSTAARAVESLSNEEEALLARMIAWAEKAAHRPDAKAAALIAWLDQTCRPGGDWNNERVIVFTEYRDTQLWLQDLLVRHGFEANRLALLYGGLDTEKRERIKAEFQAPPNRSPIRILLATDAASEGIDLQLQCHRMVHVEIPFSPTRLEQRNGRIDRHGQPSATVEICHFVSEGFERAKAGSLDGDLDFLWRIAQKVNTIRDDLGTAGPVLAQQVEEAMLGRRDAVDDRELDRAKAKASRTALKLERNLRDEIKRLRQQLGDSVDELDITPETVARVVSVALELARQPRLTPFAQHAGCYKVGALSNAWALAKVGLADPLTETERPITFDHAVADRDRDVVLAHLQHRLVAQATRLLRAEIWKTGGEKTLHRVSASLATNDSLRQAAAIAHARLVVTGQDGHRLHEEIISAGGWIRQGRFARLAVGEIKKVTTSATQDRADVTTERTLARQWTSIEDALYRALESRAEEQTSSLDRRLRERAEFEVSSIESVLIDLKRNIEAELTELEGEAGRQLRLQFTSDDERVQLDRDIAALRHRLQEIPDEIAREQEAIRRRYSTPQYRVFPAAVTFVVPPDAGAGL
jgi:superfamily II DNA or RNA helicase